MVQRSWAFSPRSFFSFSSSGSTPSSSKTKLRKKQQHSYAQQQQQQISYPCSSNSSPSPDRCDRSDHKGRGENLTSISERESLISQRMASTMCTSLSLPLTPRPLAQTRMPCSPPPAAASSSMAERYRQLLSHSQNLERQQRKKEKPEKDRFRFRRWHLKKRKRKGVAASACGQQEGDYHRLAHYQGQGSYRHQAAVERRVQGRGGSLSHSCTDTSSCSNSGMNHGSDGGAFGAGSSSLDECGSHYLYGNSINPYCSSGGGSSNSVPAIDTDTYRYSHVHTSSCCNESSSPSLGQNTTSDENGEVFSSAPVSLGTFISKPASFLEVRNTFIKDDSCSSLANTCSDVKLNTRRPISFIGSTHSAVSSSSHDRNNMYCETIRSSDPSSFFQRKDLLTCSSLKSSDFDPCSSSPSNNTSSMLASFVPSPAMTSAQILAARGEDGDKKIGDLVESTSNNNNNSDIKNNNRFINTFFDRSSRISQAGMVNDLAITNNSIVCVDINQRGVTSTNSGCSSRRFDSGNETGIFNCHGNSSAIFDYHGNSSTTDSCVDEFLGASKLDLLAPPGPNGLTALDVYFKSRHKRVMVRLCALLWLLKLDQERAVRQRQRQQEEVRRTVWTRRLASDRDRLLDTASPRASVGYEWRNAVLQRGKKVGPLVVSAGTEMSRRVTTNCFYRRSYCSDNAPDDGRGDRAEDGCHRNPRAKLNNTGDYSQDKSYTEQSFGLPGGASTGGDSGLYSSESTKIGVTGQLYGGSPWPYWQLDVLPQPHRYSREDTRRGLALYDKINSRSQSPSRRPSSDAVLRTSEVLRMLQAKAQGPYAEEIAELRAVLSSPNMKVCCRHAAV
ncbi:calcium/calmodulin-dependent serine protein kinase 1 [Plakobranchus ocellatus]|uniref:Calcium/calmodulin-dependent serine protein kinase 1 n=1 Tax=Plakobranchus ocellatus TaxID=259542 RepID=A0AAV4CJ72_9GAST|nr:calcium/calmodulin-dependent serine protein kinase 1 [Plakobranchus ocellatus]